MLGRGRPATARLVCLPINELRRAGSFRRWPPIARTPRRWCRFSPPVCGRRGRGSRADRMKSTPRLRRHRRSSDDLADFGDGTDVDAARGSSKITSFGFCARTSRSRPSAGCRRKVQHRLSLPMRRIERRSSTRVQSRASSRTVQQPRSARISRAIRADVLRYAHHLEETVELAISQT